MISALPLNRVKSIFLTSSHSISSAALFALSVLQATSQLSVAKMVLYPAFEKPRSSPPQPEKRLMTFGVSINFLLDILSSVCQEGKEQHCQPVYV